MRGYLVPLLGVAALVVAAASGPPRPGTVADAADTSPTPTPSPYLQFGPMSPAANQASDKRYILILPIASDAPTARRISVELSGELHQRHVIDESKFQVISAPGLASVENLVAACATPAQTLAGAIVLIPGTATSNDGYLLATRNWSHIDTDVLLVRCTDQVPGPVAQVIWTDNDITGNGTRWSVNLLPLAAIAAAIASFNGRSEKDTKQTTYSYASPLPTPAPGATFATTSVNTNEVDKTNANTADSTLLGLSALGALSSLSAASNSLTVAGVSNDALLKVAAKHLSKALVDDLVSKQLNGAICNPMWFAWPSPASTPSAGSMPVATPPPCKARPAPSPT